MFIRRLLIIATLCLGAACDSGHAPSQRQQAGCRETVVGLWKTEKARGSRKSSEFLLLIQVDGTFELDERVIEKDEPPETLVWKGKWTVVEDYFRMNVDSLNGHPLGLANPLKWQSYKIKECTNAALIMISANYFGAVEATDKSGEMREHYTYQYIRKK